MCLKEKEKRKKKKLLEKLLFVWAKLWTKTTSLYFQFCSFACSLLCFPHCAHNWLIKVLKLQCHCCSLKLSSPFKTTDQTLYRHYTNDIDLPRLWDLPMRWDTRQTDHWSTDNSTDRHDSTRQTVTHDTTSRQTVTHDTTSRQTVTTEANPNQEPL